jgi:hypothetical protein
MLAIMPPLPAVLIGAPPEPAASAPLAPPTPAPPVVAVVPAVLIVVPRPAVLEAVTAPLPPTAALAALPPLAAEAGLPALVVPAAPTAGDVLVPPGVCAAVESLEFEQPVSAHTSANIPQEKRFSCMARSVRSGALASTRMRALMRETAIF